jgi:hypothetical protein
MLANVRLAAIFARSANQWLEPDALQAARFHASCQGGKAGAAAAVKAAETAAANIVPV